MRTLILMASAVLPLALCSCMNPKPKPVLSGVGVEWQGVAVQDAQIEFHVVCPDTVPVDRPAIFQMQAGDGETTASALLEAAWESQGKRACTAARYGRRVRFVCRLDCELVMRVRQTTGTDTEWYEVPVLPGHSLPCGLTLHRVP